MDGSARAKLLEASRNHVIGCFARVIDGDCTPPLVVCARHKAQAIYAELEALAVNEEDVDQQLATIRDAAIDIGHAAEAVAPLYEARCAEVRSAAARKRAALQTEAVSADAALDDAIAAIAALNDVCGSHRL